MLAEAKPLHDLESEAGNAARLLKLLANEQRLLILCRLSGAGEMSVNSLVQAVGLGQSALSQHLAKMRLDGLVAFRRDGTTLYYRISDERASTILHSLKDVFCPPTTDA